ncbi:hypothetical protein EJB05_40994, partial [Eragrostis curvula]
MKPRPYGCRTAAAADGLVGAACGGWAWTPRPRARSAAGGAAHSEHHHRHARGVWFRPAGAACGGSAWRPRARARWAAVSPKCPHAAAAATGAVHSEHHHHHRVSGVLFRQDGLPGTEYWSELEARIEKFIYACRFMTFLAIGGLLLGSVPCFFKGCVYVMDAFVEYYLHGGGKVILLMLVEAIDMFLLGTVMIVVGTGLYELFVSNMDMSYGSNLFGLFRLPGRPKWLVIDSLNDLKTKLGHVIVMLLLVGIFEKSLRVTIATCTDLFCFAASIFLSSGCLYLLSRLQTKGGSHA